MDLGENDVSYLPPVLKVDIVPVAQVGGDAPQLREGLGDRDHMPGAGDVHPGVPHVGDEEHVVFLHLLEHREQPLVVQDKVLKLRVELHPVHAVLPHPGQLLPEALAGRVEGAAGDELGVRLRLAENIAVDVLHLVGGGGGGEDHGAFDSRLAQGLHQLRHTAVVVGGLREVEVLGGGHGGLSGDLLRENVGVHVDDSHDVGSYVQGAEGVRPRVVSIIIAHTKPTIK